MSYLPKNGGVAGVMVRSRKFLRFSHNMQDAAKSELTALRILASAESRSDKGNQPKR